MSCPRLLVALAAALLAPALSACTSRSNDAPEPRPRASAPAALAQFPAFAQALAAAAPLAKVDRGFEVRWSSLDGALVRPTGALVVTLPDHAGGAMRVASFADPKLWIETRARASAPVAAKLEGDVLRMIDAATGIEEVYFASLDRAEEIHVLPRAERVELAWELRKGPSVGAVRLAGNDVIEVLDRGGRVRLRTEPVFAVDARGARRSLRLELVGDSVRARLDARDLVAPIAVDPAWVASAGAMPFASAHGAATTLSDGKILYAGGSQASGSESVGAATYDPATDTWKAVGTMKAARRGPALLTLPSGHVLAIASESSTSTVEEYDPVTETWSFVAPMTHARGGPLAALLPDGRVMVVGGSAGLSGKPLPGEIYDPGTNAWTLTRAPFTNLGGWRGGAMVLASGKIAFAQGSRAELYDPTTDSWTLGPEPSFTHNNTDFVEIGGALFAVGHYQSTSNRNQEIERFDPVTMTWAHVGRATALPNHAIPAVGLASGKVFSLPSSTAANLFDPATGISTFAGRPTATRSNAALARLPDDKVLAIGGGGYLATSEIWSMPTAPNGTACTVADDCASLRCVDGVCCDSPCDGECTSCALPGKLGTCSPVPSGDDPHGWCSGPCAAGCNAGVCVYEPKGTTCDTDWCSAASLQVGTCTGYDGTCLYTSSACPGGLRCQDSTSCKKGCTSAADCVSGPCDATTGTCVDHVVDAGSEPPPEAGPPDTGGIEDASVAEDTGVVADASLEDTSLEDAAHAEDSGAPDTAADTHVEDTLPPVDVIAPPPPNEGGAPIAPPVGEATRCSTGADCATGFCADGVCCDRPCNERCHSCALPGSLGRCTPSPAGVDLRNECGPPLDCIGTCDGRGYCTGAAKGTQCARPTCTGPSTGVGQALCTGPGVRCPTLTAERFDCAPFACDPVFGACHARCTATDQCAPGYVCDSNAQVCVAPAAAEDEGGCSVSGSPGRRGSGLSALLLVAAVIAARRGRLFASIASASVLSIGCSAKNEAPPTEAVAPATDRASGILRSLRALEALGPRLPPGGALERHPDGYRIASERHGPGFRPAGAPALDVRLPLTADGATRISVPRDPEVWITIAAEGNGKVWGVPVERALVHEGVARDTDLVLFAERHRFEDLRVLRSPHAPTRTRYRVELGAGVASLRLNGDRVEVVDSGGELRFHSEPAFAVDARGVRRTLKVELETDGRVATLVTELDPTGLAYPIAIDPAFTALANPAAAHNRGRGVLLGGKAVFVGGRGAEAHATVDSYDPATDTWSTLAPMLEPREHFAMVKLPSGALVVAGGQNTPSNGLATAEKYDSVTNTWTAIAPMAMRRGNTDGVLLDDGRVLVVGGGYTCGLFCGATYATAEAYDPTTDTWATVGSMQIPRNEPHLHKTASGKVLVLHDRGNTRTQVDLFDPTTDTWSIAAPLPVGRRELLSATLASGKVAVFGGAFAGVRTDVYDESTNTWTQVSDVLYGHNDGTAALLPDGRVLMAGDGISDTAELYDESKDVFVKVGTHAGNLDLAPAVVLPSGQVVFAGSGAVMAQLWSPPVALGEACIEAGDCQSGNCVAGVCCSVTSCAAGSWCATAGAKGVCKKLSGQSCTTTEECGSGFCVDGVCCATACAGACTSCGLSSSRGICVAVAEGDDPHDKCPSGPCSACKAGACVLKPAGASCGTTCSGSTLTHGACKADGTCETTSEPCGGALVCEDAIACRTWCDSHADCTTGVCSDGACADDVIVDAGAPDGADATVDAVAPDTGGAIDSSAPGDAGGDVSLEDSSVATDSGAPDSSAEDATVSDTDPSTDAVVEDGSIEDSAPKDAPVDSGAGPDTGAVDVSVAAPGLDGDTPTLPASIQRCTRDEECSTGHCSDGVCCDTACADRCHSCAQLDSPGVCKPLPAGVDLRGECGPIGTCVATCDGAGKCVGAGKGTQCAQQRCTGKSTGLGPAYCAGEGAPCSVESSVAFDCAPYVCEPLFGACTTTCTNTDECSAGFVCDPGSKQCVAPPAPAEEEAGCSTGRAPARGASGFATLALALALAIAVARRRAATPGRGEP